MGRILSGKSPVPIAHPKSNEGPPSQETSWRMEGAEFSACDSVASPFNPAVVKAIRKEIDPKFVPLSIKRMYVSDEGERREFEHHALAWKITNPKKQHQQRTVRWPSDPKAINFGFDGSALLIEDILCGEDLPGGLPGQFYPISFTTLEIMRARKKAMEMEPENNTELARQILNAQAEKKEKSEAALKAEIDYRVEHEAPAFQRAFDKLSGPDVENWGHKEHEKKPFVQIKRGNE